MQEAAGSNPAERIQKTYNPIPPKESMARLGIRFETTFEEAEKRVSKSGAGIVTPSGDYYREEEVSINMFQRLRNIAEEDPEATIELVQL